MKRFCRSGKGQFGAAMISNRNSEVRMVYSDRLFCSIIRKDLDDALAKSALKIYVNGVLCKGLLDTGASANFMDPKMA